MSKTFDMDADDKGGKNNKMDTIKSSKGDRDDDRPQSSVVIKAEENRRILKWVSFTRAKVSFGFQHLSSAYVPAMLEEPHGYAICLEKVSGWSIPSAVLKQFGKGDFEITAQLSFSMFHLSSSTFFGTTWMGPSVSLGHGNTEISKLIDFQYTDIVYLLSRITDPTCVGIIEIVVSKFDLRKNLVASQFGCGWTMVNLFKKPNPPDIAEGHENVTITSCQLFTGSPRDLILNTDLKTLASRLKEIPGCSLYFKLFSHRRLLRAHRLIAENEALGRYDVVAGLVQREVAPPGSTVQKLLPCIGDEALLDDRTGVMCLPAAPRLATAFTLRIGNLQMYMPDRRAMEVKMLQEYASLLQLKDYSKVFVVSRKLRIGLHNGNTVLGGDWQTYPLQEDSGDHDVLFTPPKTDITVEGYVPDMYMALAFLVEYELGIPAPRHTHFNSQLMMRSTTWADGRLVTAFTVCSSVYIPFNGTRLLLKNTSTTAGSEDGVDIELQLLKDEACTLLSARPLILVKGSTLGADEAQDKGRTSLRAGDKDTDTSKAKVLEEEDTGNPLLGFDLRVFHPVLGEVLHNTDMAEYAMLDMKKTLKNTLKNTTEEADRELEESRKRAKEKARLKDTHDDSDVDVRDEGKHNDDEDGVDAGGNRRSFRASANFKSRGFEVTKQDTLRTMRSDLLRDRLLHYDDNESVAESIVTGNSEHSSLRIDALYYTQNSRTRDPRSYTNNNNNWDNVSEQSDVRDVRTSHHEARFSVPKDRNSLLAQSLQTKLVNKDHTMQGLNYATTELIPNAGAAYGAHPEHAAHRALHSDRTGMQIAPRTSINQHLVTNNNGHIRELTRGARSRLSRHGFDNALIDTPLESVLDNPLAASLSHKSLTGKNVIVDLALEARDELSLHEINIQFAGYRVGAAHNTSNNSNVPNMRQPSHQQQQPLTQIEHYAPRAVYFSYQFYSCMPTRTEIMRVVPNGTNAGLCVLLRDEAHARDEVPLTLRYMIDTSSASFHEAIEFAEYLAHTSLYIDVWDANTLLHIGVMGIPLRKLMRQQSSMSKCTLECDVINYELYNTIHSGVSSMCIVDNGPITGTVVGAVQIILANIGHEGSNKQNALRDKHQHAFSDDLNNPSQGYNWRAESDHHLVNAQNKSVNTYRPRNSVRAKPLAESAPDLQKALSDVRHSVNAMNDTVNRKTLRSLTDTRGGSSISTLTSDELHQLFQKFRGTKKGTVQYTGPLLALMDMPSLSVALKKLVLMYRKFGDFEAMHKELLRHSDSASELNSKDLTEALRSLFQHAGVAAKPEELILLAEKISSVYSVNSTLTSVSADSVMEFCAQEADRHEWTIVGDRLRVAAQKATLHGLDVEQALSAQDTLGTHYITTSRFKEFLRQLHQAGSFPLENVNIVCRHFSRRHPITHSSNKNISSVKDVHSSVGEEKDPVSIQEVLAFLGIEYVGNIQLRIQQHLRKESEKENGVVYDVHRVLQILNTITNTPTTSAHYYSSSVAYTYDTIEALFNTLGVYTLVSHAQVRSILHKLDAKSTGKVTLIQVLTYLGIPFKASDFAPRKEEQQEMETTDTVKEQNAVPDVETLLRMLLEKVQASGVFVDESFRHFDTNGDGSITHKEFALALSKLNIFNSIPNYQSQLPALMRKFDANNDGEISLKEFYTYLGIVYTPNIIQRLTKIFAVCATKNVSVKDIFQHLDSDHSGSLDAKELKNGLKSLDFEVSAEDINSIIAHFDKDGDKLVSINEFVDYFTERVALSVKERNKRRADKVAVILRKTFTGAVQKGASLKDIFGHLDKDQSGTIDTKELRNTIMTLPSFKNISTDDINALMHVLDSDQSGDVSYKEFENFIQDGSIEEGTVYEHPHSIHTSEENAVKMSLIERIRETFRVAAQKGLSFEKTFRILDSDHSGAITESELRAALFKLPNFKTVTAAEVGQLFGQIDTDNSGSITMREFQAFVEGKPIVRNKKHSYDSKHADEDEHMHGRNNKDRSPAEYVELLIRHVKRIALTDGSIAALLAHLDRDGDGLIEVTRFKTLLRREEVFEAVPEEMVMSILQPCMYDLDHLRSPALLRFFEDGTLTVKRRDTAESEHVTLPAEYTFSSDPDIRALEKKIRHFGHLLSKKGVNVEELFAQYDVKGTGMLTRSELMEVLSKLGMYLLERGQAVNNMQGEKDITRLQMQQVNRLKGKGGVYVQNAPRMAQRLLRNDSSAEGDFKDHLEGMTLVNWYRQGQKQMLLQRVLSQSLSHHIHLYPRFGKALFFEYPITNPFAHEECFQIHLVDPELRLVTAFDEWLHLRRACRPAVGELGQEPVEAEMFDKDAQGLIQVSLLPGETLYIPFTFMTLLPYVSEQRHVNKLHAGRAKHHNGAISRFSESKHTESKREDEDSKIDDAGGHTATVDETAARIAEVKIVSSTHGHIMSILKVHVCPRPFVLNRTLRFQEPENSIMKRRVLLLGHENNDMFSNAYVEFSNKFVHCVEGGAPAPGTTTAPSTGAAPPNSKDPEQSRVVVEWGPSNEHFNGAGALDLLIRYRCGAFPSTGTFYLMIYNDPYQSQLHEIWQVIVQTRQRLDIHGSVGCATLADLVIRGDKYARRARAYTLHSNADIVVCKPEPVFQLVPGAYNRVSVSVSPKIVGYRHIQLNVVDEDSRELVSAWLLQVSATAPAVMRSYDVDIPVGRPLHKKIVFKNPWDVPRVFTLTSSDPALMRPRTETVEVAALGTSYLRLWFSGLEQGACAVREVHLFLNDSVGGQNEECYLFRIRDV